MAVYKFRGDHLCRNPDVRGRAKRNPPAAESTPSIVGLSHAEQAKQSIKTVSEKRMMYGRMLTLVSRLMRGLHTNENGTTQLDAIYQIISSLRRVKLQSMGEHQPTGAAVDACGGR
jgi:hypothetical protein